MAGFGRFARVAKEVRRDVLAARDRDPAARGVSPVEILATWPGIHALLAYRVAHALQLAGVPVAPRLISMLTRAVTGIEIHPAACIGQGLFIDHGAGVAKDCCSHDSLQGQIRASLFSGCGVPQLPRGKD